jgi:1-acyl-sn-glycerol-3-phosphate acyltransferase
MVRAMVELGLEESGAVPPKPGDLGYYDEAYADHHEPWIGRLFDRYFRTDVEGLDHVPDQPFVSVGNHNGSVMMPDLVVWMSHYHRLRHRLRRATKLLALSHDLIFTLPPARFSTALAKLGALRATRANALGALERGFAIHAYPGGDFDATKPFRKRHEINFAGHTGYARVALRAGVPIVPVVSVGAHEILYIFSDGSKLARTLGLDKRARMPVLPIMALLPWGLWVGIPPGFLPLPSQIGLRVLPPILPSTYAGRDEDQAVARIDLEVRTRMQAALTDMARGRIPLLGKLRRSRA